MTNTTAPVQITTDRAHYGRNTTWTVSYDGASIGRVTAQHFCSYTAEVHGFQIDDTYSTLDLAAAAIVVAHSRAAAL